MSVMPLRQRFQHIIQPRRITQGDHAPVAFSRDGVARPITHAPARALHDRHQRGDVVQLQPGLHDDIDMPRRDQAIIIAVPTPHRIAALPRQP